MNNVFYNYKNYDKNKSINVTFSKEKTTNIFVEKLNLYNLDSNIPMQKIWILIENCKICFIDDTVISIAVSNKNEKLISFMENLDKQINKIIEDNISKIDTYMPSMVESPLHIMNLRFTEDSIFLGNNEACVDIKDLKLGNNVSICIELSSVYINKKKDCKIWQILQLKKNTTIDFTKSLFGSSGAIQLTSSKLPNRNPVKVTQRILSSIPSIPSTPSISFSPPPPPPKKKEVSGPSHLLFSMADLATMKNKLKKPRRRQPPKIKETKININPLAGLKKVITREPKSGVELMSDKLTEHVKRIIKLKSNIDFNKFMTDKQYFKDYKKSIKIKKLFKESIKLDKKYYKMTNRLNS